MPYAPGVQDISGQLLAQGMQQRAQGIAGGVQTLFQGLQQNQMMTNQALGRFQAALAANPALLNALSGAQDPNDLTGVKLNPDVIKAYSDVTAGKTNVQNTALLAQFADTYNQAQANQQQRMLQQAQAANLLSEASLRAEQLKQLQQPKVPSGQIMTLEAFRKLPADVDAKGEPVPGMPGMVNVTGFNLRAPIGLKSEDLGDRVAFFDAAGNLVKSIPKGAAPIQGMALINESEQAQPPAVPAPTAPASLAQFAPPPTGGPAILGQFMPPRQGAAAQPGAQAAAAMASARPAAQPAAPSPTGQRYVAIPGSPAAIAQEEKRAQEAAAAERKLDSANTMLDVINEMAPRVSATSVGLGSMAKNIPNTEAANVAALLTQLQAQTAFNELRALKSEKTTLGQVAIREIELLQNATAAINQNMSPELFKKQLEKLKAKTETTRARLMQLEQDRQNGLTQPSRNYYELGGKSLTDLNQAIAAPNAATDPFSAVRAAGFKVKQ